MGPGHLFLGPGLEPFILSLGILRTGYSLTSYLKVPTIQIVARVPIVPIAVEVKWQPE